MIDNFVLSKDDTGTYYYISLRHHIVGMIHPKLSVVIAGNKEVLSTLSPEDLEYYKSKLEYWESQGIFGSKEQRDENYFRPFTPQIVEHSIASTEQLVFEVTDSCNLRCEYCAYRDMYEGYDVRQGKNMSVQDGLLVWNKLNEIFKKNAGSREGHLTIGFYGGEPLLNFGFIKELVSRIEDTALFPIRFNMTTNGMLLKKYCHFLSEHEFDLLISLDGDRQMDSYRKTAKDTASFDEVIDNIDYLKDHYPSYFDKHVQFNAVLHDRNDIAGIYEFIHTRYKKSPRIGTLNPDGIVDKERFKKMSKSFAQDFEVSTNRELVYDKFFTLTPIYRNLEHFWRFFFNQSISSFDELMPLREKHTIPTGTCLPFNKKIFITVNKKMLVCEKIDHAFSLSTVKPDDDLFNYAKIATIYNQYFAKISHTCMNCYRLNFCGKCLFSNRESLMNKHFICPDFLNRHSIGAYLTELISFIKFHPDCFKRMLD